MWIQSLGWEDPLEKGGQPTPIFLPGESHGPRSLMGYSPRDCRVGHNCSDLAFSLKCLPLHSQDYLHTLDMLSPPQWEVPSFCTG